MTGKRCVVALIVMGVVVLFLIGRPSVAPELTYNKFIQIAPGMSTDDVLKAIGAPLSISVVGNMVCMNYAEQSLLGLGFEMAVCCEDGLVSSIGVERYDLGLYWWRDGDPKPQIKDEDALRRAFKR
ncbi:MAG: hypothetical protein M9963_04150 [Kiritimatiellae bacterium]|nr:hypothetical protein [Kiritimatiellia bacterium]MCO5067753.1 hypothetical protein [Kiritimatiellia bacterium]